MAGRRNRDLRTPTQSAGVGPEPHPLRSTRASRTWVGLGVAVIFLIALIIFIAQNGERVDIHFLTLHAHVANGIALLIAAVGGAVVTLLAGSVRIMQLRRTARRHRQADLTPNAGGPASAATGGPTVVDDRSR